MKKILTLPRVNIILFTSLLVFLAVVLFYPVEPLKINSLKIEGNSFKAGGEMGFVIDRCKYVSNSVPGTASRYFVNTEDSTKPDIFISSTDDLGDKGCATVKRTMDIPAHIKDGVYRLKFVTRYYPSILREPTTVEYVTEETFTVKGQELTVQLDSINHQLNSLYEAIGGQKSVSNQGLSNSIQLNQLREIIMPKTNPTPITPTAPANPKPPVSNTEGESLQSRLKNTTDAVKNITNILEL